jgi:hypothetical protein
VAQLPAEGRRTSADPQRDPTAVSDPARALDEVDIGPRRREPLKRSRPLVPVEDGLRCVIGDLGSIREAHEVVSVRPFCPRSLRNTPGRSQDPYRIEVDPPRNLRASPPRILRTHEREDGVEQAGQRRMGGSRTGMHGSELSDDGPVLLAEPCVREHEDRKTREETVPS